MRADCANSDCLQCSAAFGRNQKHPDFEQEETEQTEAVTLLCSLSYLLFEKTARTARAN
jgi:hypothetical protein